MPDVSWLLLPSAAPSSRPVAHTCPRGPVIHRLGRRIATWELSVTSLEERVDAGSARRARSQEVRDERDAVGRDRGTAARLGARLTSDDGWRRADTPRVRRTVRAPVEAVDRSRARRAGVG